MTKFRERLVLLFVSAMLLFPLSAFANSPVRDGNLTEVKAPNFTISNIKGDTLSLEKALGKYKAVVLNFWGLRCGACIQEIPHLNEMVRKHGADVMVLGVNVDAVNAATLKDQIERIGLVMEYEIVPDPEFKLIDMFRMTAAPLTVIIDSEGIVKFRHENYEPGDEEKIEGALARILGQGTHAK